MKKIKYETNQFEGTFKLENVISILEKKLSDHPHQALNEINNFIISATDDEIIISETMDHFPYIVIDLIKSGSGMITCKECNKTYKAAELKKVNVGHGSNPLSSNLKQEKGGLLKKLFGKKERVPGMSGGTGYQCPEGHELLSVRTWMT